MLKECETKEENPSAISKISELQQQVNVFEPFMKRSEQSNGEKTPIVRITDEKMREKKFRERISLIFF